MLNQMYSEWIKLRSVRSTVVMFILAIVFSVAIAGLGQIGATADNNVNMAFLGILFSQIFFMVLGIQIIGQEYRFKTIRSTFAATPKRWTVIFAKFFVLIVTIAITTIFLILLSILTSQIVLAIQGHSLSFAGSDSSRVIIATFLTSILYAVFGLAIGSIIRQPVAAIVLSLIWIMAVEAIVGSILTIWDIEIYHWFPFQAMTLASSPGDFMVESGTTMLDPYVGILYVSAIFITLFIIGSTLIARRDA